MNLLMSVFLFWFGWFSQALPFPGPGTPHSTSSGNLVTYPHDISQSSVWNVSNAHVTDYRTLVGDSGSPSLYQDVTVSTSTTYNASFVATAFVGDVIIELTVYRQDWGAQLLHVEKVLHVSDGPISWAGSFASGTSTVVHFCANIGSSAYYQYFEDWYLGP
jgi:hypothetical protein